jgi:hypothetical protein
VLYEKRTVPVQLLYNESFAGLGSTVAAAATVARPDMRHAPLLGVFLFFLSSPASRYILYNTGVVAQLVANTLS